MKTYADGLREAADAIQIDSPNPAIAVALRLAADAIRAKIPPTPDPDPARAPHPAATPGKHPAGTGPDDTLLRLARANTDLGSALTDCYIERAAVIQACIDSGCASQEPELDWLVVAAIDHARVEGARTMRKACRDAVGPFALSIEVAAIDAIDLPELTERQAIDAAAGAKAAAKVLADAAHEALAALYLYGRDDKHNRMALKAIVRVLRPDIDPDDDAAVRVAYQKSRPPESE